MPRPSSNSRTSAVPTSTRVLGIASPSASATGRCRAKDSPSWPWASAPRYFAYCSGSDWSSPNWCRRRATTAGSIGVSPLGRNGSPGARCSSRNVKVTTAKTMASEAATRRTSHVAT